MADGYLYWPAQLQGIRTAATVCITLLYICTRDDRACLHLAAYHQHAHVLDRSTHPGAIRTYIVLTTVVACSHAFPWISRIFDGAQYDDARVHGGHVPCPAQDI